MKIIRLEFENFRNFKDKNVIEFASDGKVTIIYGKNGDGKTTLHQLFQWVFYGEVHFNKTASKKLYNHEFEASLKNGEEFRVYAKLDFEHNNDYYTLLRQVNYKKALFESVQLDEDFILRKKNSENNWDRVNNPKSVIEELMPKGLSQYFFFDGENMIADLKVKGSESASSLRNAIYSIFDLNIYEKASKHIGNKDLRTTAIGSIYLNKDLSYDADESANQKMRINNVQSNIETLQSKLVTLKQNFSQAAKNVADLSEQIGSVKSATEYELERSKLKKNRDLMTKSISDKKLSFGQNIVDMVPTAIISKVVLDAKNKLKLKVAQDKLITGVNKPLIEALTKEDVCLCGRCIGDTEREILKNFFKLLPPNSYKGMYDDFTKAAEKYVNNFDEKKLDSIISDILDYKKSIKEIEDDIVAIDGKLKLSRDIEPLIIDRKKAEEEMKDTQEKIRECDEKLNQLNLYLKKEMKRYDEAIQNSANNQIIDKKMQLLTKAQMYFDAKLDETAKIYSKKLQESIQYLIDKMLTSKRTVEVREDFHFKVTDTYNDESKSEGQFAVVSFAYIGGILKLLKEEASVLQKEYPLILDGPFSKLDFEQRQNVIDTIPEYAPQVILFSKDELQSLFGKDQVGKVYTIQSNLEKNVASVKEGFLWN